MCVCIMLAGGRYSQPAAVSPGLYKRTGKHSPRLYVDSHSWLDALPPRVQQLPFIALPADFVATQLVKQGNPL
jgi:hypothetical protein